MDRPGCRMLIRFCVGGEMDVPYEEWTKKKRAGDTFSLFLFFGLSMFHRPT